MISGSTSIGVTDSDATLRQRENVHRALGLNSFGFKSESLDYTTTTVCDCVSTNLCLLLNKVNRFRSSVLQF